MTQKKRPKVADRETRKKQALEEWEKDRSQILKHIAYEYDVPYSSLNHLKQGRKTHKDAAEDQQLFSKVEEEELVNFCVQLIDWGHPPTVENLRTIATGCLQRKHDDLDKRVRKHWTKRFLKRHPQLETTFSRALDNNRAKATHPETIRRWFDLLAKVKEEYQIKVENTYNFDEKGVLMGQAAVAKIIAKLEESRRFKTQPGNRELVTIIECINCLGWAIPPLIVFKGKHHLSGWFEQNLVEGCRLAYSQRGWTDTELAIEWLTKCFDEYTKEHTQKDEYRLLILDGHNSHVTFNFVLTCHKKRIIPLCLPPHATHLLQPLDVGVFGPLQRLTVTVYQENVESGVTQSTRKSFLIYTKQHAKNQSGRKSLYPPFVLQVYTHLIRNKF